MILKEIHVRNFRCLKDSTASFNGFTALIGPNGAGKSSLLTALEMFFDPAAKYEKEDYYQSNTDDPIEVAITFAGLNSDEIATFSSYVHDQELKVVKLMSYPSKKDNQKYYGQRLRNPDFSGVRSQQRADETRSKYASLRDNYSDLPDARTKDEIFSALNQWELDHPEQCQLTRDEGQFFGYREVGEGRIEKYIKFLMIPAVREAAQDATETRGSILNELMEITIRKLLSEKESVRELEKETQKKYFDILNTDELKNLESQLSTLLSTYAPGVEVKIRWMPKELDMLSIFKTNAFLVEDGYESPVSLSGHGSQRAFVMSLLQYLAMANPTGESSLTTPQPKQSLILAIEEPELYQHPNRQRHLLKVIKELSAGSISQIFNEVQVVYATHSPLLIHIDDFDSARRLNKKDLSPPMAKQTSISWSTLDDLAMKLSRATEESSESFTGETLRPRLQAIMTPWMNEGFFSNTVVLVEGEEDRAALVGEQALMGYDFDSLGIAVIPCGGKSNIDRPFVIFDSLDIPVYAIWDNDRDSNEKRIGTNHVLLKLLGQKVEDFPSVIADNFSCFDKNLGEVLRGEIGSDLFDSLLSKYKKMYGLRKLEQAKKNSIVIKEVLNDAKTNGKECETQREIVNKILALHDKARITTTQFLQ